MTTERGTLVTLPFVTDHATVRICAHLDEEMARLDSANASARVLSSRHRLHHPSGERGGRAAGSVTVRACCVAGSVGGPWRDPPVLESVGLGRTPEGARRYRYSCMAIYSFSCRLIQFAQLHAAPQLYLCVRSYGLYCIVYLY